LAQIINIFQKLDKMLNNLIYVETIHELRYDYYACSYFKFDNTNVNCKLANSIKVPIKVIVIPD